MGHTFSNLLVHTIFSTKGRLPTIRERFRPRLYEYMSGIARTEFGRALCLGGTPNHVHGRKGSVTCACTFCAGWHGHALLRDHVAMTGQAPFEAHGHATARDHATPPKD